MHQGKRLLVGRHDGDYAQEKLNEFADEPSAQESRLKIADVVADGLIPIDRERREAGKRIGPGQQSRMKTVRQGKKKSQPSEDVALGLNGDIKVENRREDNGGPTG